jgi:hypothetical protein
MKFKVVHLVFNKLILWKQNMNMKLEIFKDKFKDQMIQSKWKICKFKIYLIRIITYNNNIEHYLNKIVKSKIWKER